MATGNRCKCVLIVEDDADIRETLRQLLEMEGYEVQVATNGKEGLEALKTIQRPCLILLDLMMPVMNGWEFLQARQDDIFLATIPVVVVSAIHVDQAKNPGVTGFIKKPVDLEHLLTVVNQYCG